MAFSDSPIVLKISFLVAALALLVHIIGMASPYWIDIKVPIKQIDIHEGLWEGCVSGVCSSGDAPEWLTGVQAVEVIGVLVIVLSLAAIAGSIFTNSDSTTKILKVVAMLSSFSAGLFIIIGVIVYVAKFDLDLSNIGISFTDYLSWAFGLCVAGGILSAITGVLVVLSFFM